ncbi:MAG: hypothetical protein K2G93_00955 [Rikenella sp.]|nr:hypothetical protein [Rikenella sp.]
MKNAIFTICAKNYLAQALTLQETVCRHNPDVDFFLFISDLKDSPEVPDSVVELDEEWIPAWRQMAFKYSVIEFSTSIKPFCFAKLFKAGYDRVIYLDPDMYVMADLTPVFSMLEAKSIVLSPHYCNIQIDYTGSVPEEELLWVGIYNLGFGAIKNDEVGRKIVEWWCNRLENKCYADPIDGLHVDQKWLDFVPGFFPNDVHITHHMGINPAIWNLHERELEITAEGTYMIRNTESKELFPLLFFHFSGFDPFNPTVLNRRHSKYGIEQFPSFKPLIDEYVVAEYRNGYDKFSKLCYSFNSFENGENIMPIHRRIYRSLEQKVADPNPFAVESRIYRLLQTNKLLSGIKSSAFKTFSPGETAKKGRFVILLRQLLCLVKKTFGIRYYMALLNNLTELTRYENQRFLIKKFPKD